MKTSLTKSRVLPYFCMVLIIFSVLIYTPVLAENNNPKDSNSGEEAEPAIIQWYLIGDSPTDFSSVSEKANEYIRNKLNAEINFNFISWGEFLDDKQKQFASGEQIDITFAAGWWNYEKDVANGYYYPLNGLIDEFAPKTKALIGENLLKAAEIEDKIYALPVPGQNNSYASGIGFRKDLVKKYNIDLSKIKKIQDIEPILKTLKSKEPNIIPFYNKASTLSYDVLNMERVSGSMPSPGCLSFNNNDMKLFNEFAKADTKAFYKILNRFYKLGYIKKPKNIYDDREIYKVFAVLDTYDPLYNGSSQTSDRIIVYLGKPDISNSSSTQYMNAISSNTIDPELDLKIIELVNTDPT